MEKPNPQDRGQGSQQQPGEKRPPTQQPGQKPGEKERRDYDKE